MKLIIKSDHKETLIFITLTMNHFILWSRWKYKSVTLKHGFTGPDPALSLQVEPNYI